MQKRLPYPRLSNFGNHREGSVKKERHLPCKRDGTSRRVGTPSWQNTRPPNQGRLQPGPARGLLGLDWRRVGYFDRGDGEHSGLGPRSRSCTPLDHLGAAFTSPSSQDKPEQLRGGDETSGGGLLEPRRQEKLHAHHHVHDQCSPEPGLPSKPHGQTSAKAQLQQKRRSQVNNRNAPPLPS